MLMGASTLLIAFLPTYAMVGWVAPLLLCILRFGQGFGLGGEWGGAALLAVENAPPGWKSRFGMFPQLGAPVGFIARSEEHTSELQSLMRHSFAVFCLKKKTHYL